MFGDDALFTRAQKVAGVKGLVIFGSSHVPSTPSRRPSSEAALASHLLLQCDSVPQRLLLLLLPFPRPVVHYSHSRWSLRDPNSGQTSVSPLPVPASYILTTNIIALQYATGRLFLFCDASPSSGSRCQWFHHPSRGTF